MKIYITLLLFFPICYGSESLRFDMEKKLREDLFVLRKFRTDVRPVSQNSDLLTVWIDLKVIHLTQLDTAKRTLSLTAFMTMSWTDINLKWNKSDYGDIDYIIIPPNLIWRPDVALYTHFDERDIFPKGNFMMHVSSEGKVLWVPSVAVSSTCETDVRYFPFDEHMCLVKFGSWTHDGFMIDIRLANENATKLDWEYLEDSSNEWEITDSSVTRNEKYYTCCVEPYPDVTFDIFLRRRSPYYVVTMVLPCICILILILTSFWLPPTATEKIILSFFNVLYVLIMLGHINWAVPRNADQIPSIVRFCGCLEVLAIVAFCSHIITMTIGRQNQYSTPPRCFQLIFGCRMTKMCCSTPDTRVRQDVSPLTSETADAQRENMEISDTTKAVDWNFIAIIIDRTMFYLFCLFLIVILKYSLTTHGTEKLT